MFHFKQIFCFALFFSLISAPLYAFEVKNLKASEKKGYIHVQYDLIGTELGETEADVAVVLEIGAKKYQANNISISGDFGPQVKVGRAKKFKWHVAKDFPSGFTGDISWDVTAMSASNRKKENELIKEIERLKSDLTGEWRQVVLKSGVLVKPTAYSIGKTFPGISRIEQKRDKVRAYMTYSTMDVNFFVGVREGTLIKGQYSYGENGEHFPAICTDIEPVTATIDDSGCKIRFTYSVYCKSWYKPGFFSSESGYVKAPIGADIEVTYLRYFDDDHIGPEGLRNKIYGIK